VRRLTNKQRSDHLIGDKMSTERSVVASEWLD